MIKPTAGGNGGEHYAVMARLAQQDSDYQDQVGRSNWAHQLVLKVYSALAQDDPRQLQSLLFEAGYHIRDWIEVLNPHPTPGTGPVVELYTQHPGPTRRGGTIPGHAGHFHPSAADPVLWIDCQMCRARMAWYRRQLDSWESGKGNR